MLGEKSVGENQIPVRMCTFKRLTFTPLIRPFNLVIYGGRNWVVGTMFSPTNGARSKI